MLALLLILASGQPDPCKEVYDSTTCSTGEVVSCQVKRDKGDSEPWCSCTCGKPGVKKPKTKK